ncbi:MAG: DoxX family protein [Gemmatimonadaceae bacterium]
MALQEETMWRALIQTSDDRIPMLARLALGIVIFPHGAQKLLGWYGGPGIDGALGSYAALGIPAVVGWLAMLTEFFGGIALIVGFLGRVMAFAIAVDMIAAVMTLHWRVGFFMNWNGQLQGEGFEFHILAVTLALVVMIRGSGALSIDRALTSRPVITQPR